MRAAGLHRRADQPGEIDRAAWCRRDARPIGADATWLIDAQGFEVGSLTPCCATTRLDRILAHDGVCEGKQIIPAALGRYQVNPFLFRGYWADVGTIESFYETNVMLGRGAAPFRFWDPARPIYTHLRHMPGSRMTDCTIRASIVSTSRPYSASKLSS